MSKFIELRKVLVESIIIWNEALINKIKDNPNNGIYVGEGNPETGVNLKIAEIINVNLNMAIDGLISSDKVVDLLYSRLKKEVSSVYIIHLVNHIKYWYDINIELESVEIKFIIDIQSQLKGDN